MRSYYALCAYVSKSLVHYWHFFVFCSLDCLYICSVRVCISFSILKINNFFYFISVLQWRWSNEVHAKVSISDLVLAPTKWVGLQKKVRDFFWWIFLQNFIRLWDAISLQWQENFRFIFGVLIRFETYKILSMEHTRTHKSLDLFLVMHALEENHWINTIKYIHILFYTLIRAVLWYKYSTM